MEQRHEMALHSTQSVLEIHVESKAQEFPSSCADVSAPLRFRGSIPFNSSSRDCYGNGKECLKAGVNSISLKPHQLYFIPLLTHSLKATKGVLKGSRTNKISIRKGGALYPQCSSPLRKIFLRRCGY